MNDHVDETIDVGVCAQYVLEHREARAALIALEQLRTPVGTFVLRWENRTLLLSYKTRAGIGHTALDIEQDGTDSLQHTFSCFDPLSGPSSTLFDLLTQISDALPDGLLFEAPLSKPESAIQPTHKQESDTLAELKSFLAGPDMDFDNAAPSRTPMSQPLVRNVSATASSRPFRTQSSSLFEEDSNAFLEQMETVHTEITELERAHSQGSAPAGVGGGVSELLVENGNLKRQVMYLTDELKTRDKRILTLQREVDSLITEVTRLRASSHTRSRASTTDTAGSRLLSSAPTGFRAVLRSNLDSRGFDVAHIEDALSSMSDEKDVRSSIDQLLDIPALSAQSIAAHGLLDESVLVQSQMLRKSQAPAAVAAFVRHSSKLSEHGLLTDTEVHEEVAAKNGSARLFHGDVVSDESAGTQPNTRAANKRPPKGEALSYQAWLQRLNTPACADLIEVIKRFLMSIRGPNGDYSPPDAKQRLKLEYEFLGKQDVRDRCASFLRSFEGVVSQHSAWKQCTDDILQDARDHVEKYVITRLYEVAFEAVEDSEMDLQLLRRMRLLSFLTPDALEVKAGVGNDMVWSLAQDELRQINTHKSPKDKVQCVVNACSVIFRSLNLARAKDPTTRPGADDFLPLFIYTVLTSHIPRLYSNCEYIFAYRNPNDLMSKAGYCLVNLRSAVEFILYMDASVVAMDPEVFNKKLAEAEASLDGFSQV